MNTPRLSYIKTLGSISILWLLTVPLGAATLIDYGPSSSYVTSDTNFARTAGSTGSGPYIFRRSFSDSNADPLSPTSNYNGPAFYGGYEFISSTIDQGFSRQQIRHDASPDSTDQIYLQSFNSGGWLGSDLSLAGVYIFKQEDFSGEFNTGDIYLDGLSVTTTGFVNTSDSSVDFEGRFVVQVSNGDYYVTQTTTDLRRNDGSFSLTGPDLQNELWAVYDPSANLNFDQGSASYGTISLTGITAVGIYFEDDSWAGTDSSNTAYGLGIRSFQATGTNIPEPSASVIIFGLTAALATLLKRRRA